MKLKTLVASTLFAGLAATSAHADTANFSLTGTNIAAQGTLTFTPNPDGSAKITAITGTFSDTNISPSPVVNATITGLVPVNPVNPLPDAVLAPDFSRFRVETGLPPQPDLSPNFYLSYDNTFYPNGSPVVCTEYPASGGFLDVYGLLFSLSTGQTVGLWSNGNFPGAPVSSSIYGLAVADANNTYDYVGDLTFVPEPASLSLLALATLTLPRRRKST